MTAPWGYPATQLELASRPAPTTLVELCAGTASLSLWALGRCAPLVGFMGSKRRWASLLTEALGVDRPERVVLVDAGPWGDVWSVLRDPSQRRRTAELLDSWDDQDLGDLWRSLVESPPPADPAQRVAQYLWLQARAAGTIPVWWSGSRWESPTGSRTEAAHARGGGALARLQKGAAPPVERGSGGARGIQRPSTVARRIRALEALPWDRIEVIHGDVREVAPILGAVVYHDPPYLGCPRYAALLPRADVLALAERWRTAGCRVAVSEADPLPLPGWTSMPLPGSRPEWVTASWPIRLHEQLNLWEPAAVQPRVDPLHARILDLLRDEVRGLVGLAQDLGLSVPELEAVLATLPEVGVYPQARVGRRRPGCPLVALRALVGGAR